jgi:hypothetical protein
MSGLLRLKNQLKIDLNGSNPFICLRADNDTLANLLVNIHAYGIARRELLRTTDALALVRFQALPGNRQRSVIGSTTRSLFSILPI